MPTIGETVICCETGRAFVIARDGCSYNYATDSEGNIFSDEGVAIRERRELLDMSKPFHCYVSTDGRSVTGWKGNKLGDAYNVGTVRLSRWSPFHGSSMFSYQVTDVHGGEWYGRGSPGMAITLRASKTRNTRQRLAGGGA